jgi:hypothetical protein
MEPVKILEQFLEADARTSAFVLRPIGTSEWRNMTVADHYGDLDGLELNSGVPEAVVSYLNCDQESLPLWVAVLPILHGLPDDDWHGSGDGTAAANAEYKWKGRQADFARTTPLGNPAGTHTRRRIS